MFSLLDSSKVKIFLWVCLFLGTLGVFDISTGLIWRTQEVTVLHITPVNAQYEFRMVVVKASGLPAFITYPNTVLEHVTAGDKLFVEGNDIQYKRNHFRTFLGILFSVIFLFSVYYYWKLFVRCQCAELTFVRNVYGDEINHLDCRSVWRCSIPKCNKIHYRMYLHPEEPSGNISSKTNDNETS